MKELRTYVVSTPSGTVALEAEDYELDTTTDKPSLCLFADGRAIAEFIHFAGIWERAQQSA
ncbi:hypothetical protein DX980_20155 [Burkholderia gladioli]|uniref:hypothetical protein n=1 Tax=Burkholderia gladioli TaxID=28095 RepID=UPI00136497D6|nr:hypothetical protein [Burkholderia gladioli]KAF1065270.1 hypothetical protein LvStA_03945 [Burkholderia gladioli]WAG21360.1 hypothetical protein DX980_20155 [Burkholderia gladioli]